jgi:hypothetical protein
MTAQEKELVPYTDPADIHTTSSGIPGYQVQSVNAVLRLKSKNSEDKAMTAQELAQRVLEIAQQALEKEQHLPVYIGDDTGEGAARAGLEAIIKMCQEVPKDQEAYKQYEKKKVSHATSKD